MQDQQVASTSSQSNEQASASNQVPISNQPMLEGIIHWTLSLVIFQDVFKQDQDWHHFVNTSHLCHPLNQRR